MRVMNFGGFNTQHIALNWVIAIDAYDYGQPDLLNQLIRTEPIPEELRTVIADIVAGDRVPNKKAAAKLKVPAGERIKIAANLSSLLYLIDRLKYDAIEKSVPGQGITALAERAGVEPLEVKRELEGEARAAIADTAEQLGVGIDTVENLLRRLRTIIKNYPDV